MEAHASADCLGCDWERHPQAFRWFPELGPPLVPPLGHTAVRTAEECEPGPVVDGLAGAGR